MAKNVYVIGAGFSAPCGIPTGNSLFDNLKSRQTFWRENIEPLFDWYNFDRENFYYEDLLSNLDSDRTFFESIVPYLEEHGHHAGMPDLFDSTVKSIRTELISEFLKQDKVFHENLKQQPPHLHLDTLIQTAAAKGDTIITFNYDICIESYAWLKDIQIRYDAQDSNLECRSITLYKLHGSLSWYKDHPRTLKPDFFIIKEGNTHILTRFDIPLEIADAGIADIATYKMVYPSMFKRFDENPFIKRCWAEARKALEEAENIYFLGYSLPAGDHLVYSLLGHSRRKENRQNVYVRDMCFREQTDAEKKAATELKKRYQQIYQRHLLDFAFCDFKDGLKI